MFLQLENFLTADEVKSVADIAAQARFIEGRRSNPHNVTKNNLIGDPSDATAQKASQIALLAFQRSDVAKEFAFPQRIAIPQLARYGAGMNYGPHIDAAFLPGGQSPLRADVSCTIFISDPATYQGGELVVYQGTQESRVKGKPGEAVFYPSTTLHQVAPVTGGERLVMITFIESQIADQGQRDLLYVLGEVRAQEGLKMDWRNRTRLEYVIANLQRMWAT
ncbi:MAG: Fe2+-dependent dioxygenase [Steroidobacteraceae bacterium]